MFKEVKITKLLAQFTDLYIALLKSESSPQITSSKDSKLKAGTGMYLPKSLIYSVSKYSPKPQNDEVNYLHLV